MSPARIIVGRAVGLHLAGSMPESVAVLRAEGIVPNGAGPAPKRDSRRDAHSVSMNHSMWGRNAAASVVAGKG
jgi:hypothetical protein